MLSALILGTTLWVCPGDVYTDQPRPGCTPFQQSDREGFGTAPSPAPEAPPHRGSASAPSVILEQSPPEAPHRSRASSQECARYREWIELSRKTEQMGAHTLPVQDFERWQILREQYSNMDPALCEDQ
jgi:hypothetical protein